MTRSWKDLKTTDGKTVTVRFEDRGQVGKHWVSAFWIGDGPELLNRASVELARASGKPVDFRFAEDMAFLEGHGIDITTINGQPE